jgi:hypothetical protein
MVFVTGPEDGVFYETLVNIYQNTRRHIEEDSNLHIYCQESHSEHLSSQNPTSAMQFSVP